MHRFPLPDPLQTVPHDHLVIPRRKNRCGHIDQDRNPAIVSEAEDLATAEEDGGDDARAQVTRQVGADGDIGEAPDHGRVGKPYGEGG